MRRFTSLLAVLLLGATAVVGIALATPADAATPTAGTYVAVTPFRVVNTATGAYRNHKGAVRHGRGFTAAIGGHGGVPRKVAAVAVTITAVSPTASGAVTAYAGGSKRPGVSNLQYAKGRNTAMSAIVRTSTNGDVTIYNGAKSGSTQLTVDVSGYYVVGAPSTSNPGVLHTVKPARLLSKVVGKRAAAVAALGGHDGVPRSGVGTAAVLITAVSPGKAGTLVAYATGHARPTDPTVHFTAKVSDTQFAIVPTDSAGRITVYNAAAGSVRVTVDVVGYTIGGVATTAGTATPQSPVRVVNGSRIGANASKTVTVAGHNGVPLNNVAAVLVTLSVSSPAKKGGLVAWKARTKRPGVTNLQFAARQTTSDFAVVPVSSKGTIGVHNASGGATKFYVDINGYIPSKTVTAPNASVSRYLSDLTANVSADGTTMSAHGCADARAGSSFVLLDVGAQSITGPQLSSSHPGVALALASPIVRLTYPQLVSLVRSYLTGFDGCSAGHSVATVAIGTSNSGAFSGATAYAAKARGTAWAANVIAPLRASAPNSIVLVGANDIENGGDFDTSLANAQSWEAAYIADTPAKLIFNGAPIGCPSTFGATRGSCNEGWTEAQFYGLAHNGSQIEVLPQVYSSAQAVQWADIDATGGGKLVFAGSLTEHAVDGSTYSAAQGWAALRQAIATVVRSPDIPAATDLRVAG